MAPLQTRAVVEGNDGELVPLPSSGINGAPIDYSQLGGFTLICEECETLGEDFCHWGRRPHRLAGGTRPIALDAEFLEPVARLHAWRPGHTLLVAAAAVGLVWVLVARWYLQRRGRPRPRGKQQELQQQQQQQPPQQPQQQQQQQQQQQRKKNTTTAAAAVIVVAPHPNGNTNDVVALSLDRARLFKVDSGGNGGGGREHQPVKVGLTPVAGPGRGGDGRVA